LKILLIVEHLDPPYDEGIKKTAYNLYSELNLKYDLRVFCRNGFNKENIEIVQVNPLFLSASIYKKIKNFDPDVLVYFPFASATFAGYLRLKVFRLFAGNAGTIFIALQPKKLKKWQQKLICFLRPELGLTPSLELKTFWDRYKIKSQILPLLTDLSVFKPLTKCKEKRKLRKKHGLPEDAFIVSHIGHLNEVRNLNALLPLQKAGLQVVVVGSSSTPEDATGSPELREILERSGIIIFDNYIEKIQEIYQLSDVYIFPVVSKTGSIGMPLSILEARACAIPVVSTFYGSIQQMLGDDYGGIIYSKQDEFLSTVKRFQEKAGADFSRSRVSDVNNLFYKITHDAIKGRL
jgi:glycosyltransferase involved in cell wall biosynthesis